MTHIDTKDNIQINGTEIEKATKCRYLGQTTAMENRTKQEVSIKINAGWRIFGKCREFFWDKHLPMSVKRKVFNQFVLPTMTYGMQNVVPHKSISKETWNTPTSHEKENANNVKLIDRICNTVIRQRTRVTDIVQNLTNTKRKWAGHIARMKDNRWTIRSTEWQIIINGVRSVGRPKRRWRDDIVGQQGAVWTRTTKDRERWRTLAEGYFLQWKDTA